MISGSRAALSITVTPLARTAAIRMFSVAPTLGKSSQIWRPVQGAGLGHEETVPFSNVAPSFCEPGDVHVEPAGADRIAAGSATSAAPQRAMSGPSTQMEARIRRTRS